MKRLGALALGLAMLFGTAACNDAQREEAGSVADDAREAAGDAADQAADTARDAADKAEDVVNDRTVDIDNFSYDPENREVSPGTEVTWVNQDSFPHTVTDEDGAFASDELEEKDEFSHRFTEKGTYTYYCKVHGKDRMSGTVTVEDDA